MLICYQNVLCMMIYFIIYYMREILKKSIIIKKIKFYFLKKIQYVTTNDYDYMPDNMILYRQRRWIILFFNIFCMKELSKKQREINEKVEKTYELFQQKKSIDEIMKIIKMSRRTVYRFLERKRKNFQH